MQPYSNTHSHLVIRTTNMYISMLAPILIYYIADCHHYYLSIINSEHAIPLTLLHYFDLNFTDQTVAFSFKILTCHWPSAVTLVMCMYDSFIVECGLPIFIIIINIIDIILKSYPSQSILLQYMTWQVSLPTPNAQIIPSEILFSPIARSQVP